MMSASKLRPEPHFKRLVLCLTLGLAVGTAPAQTSNDFDTTGTPYMGVNHPQPNSAPAPFVATADSFSSGKFLRLQALSGLNLMKTSNALGFDRTDTGSFDRVLVDFDFRITCGGARVGFACADGFSFILMRTSRFGTSGAPEAMDEAGRTATTPNESIAIGFGVFDPGFGNFPKNTVWLSFNNSIRGSVLVNQTTLDLASGLFASPDVFHHAHIDLVLGGSSPNATVELTNGATSAVVTPYSNFDLSGLVVNGLPLAPYESRVGFATRVGDAQLIVDVDNVQVQYMNLATVLTGDGNGDGTVDAADLVALLLEINDGDGTDLASVTGGSFAGTSALDVNGDNRVDLADVSALVALIFGS